MRTSSLLIAVLTLFSASAALGQTETFDYFSFATPLGFSRTYGQGYVDFIKYNEQRTGYLQLTLYVSRPGTADLDNEFISDWNSFVKSVTPSADPPVPQRGDEENGWKTIVGITPVQNPGGYFVQTLIVLVGHARVTSISVRVTDNTFQKEIDSFLVNVHMLASPSTTQPPATVAVIDQKPAQEHPTGTGSRSVAGVWRGIGTYSTVSGTTNAAGTGYSSITYGSSIKVTQVAFLEDGSFCSYLPPTGLIDYQTNRAQNPNYWGTYWFENNKGQIRQGSTEYPIAVQDGKLLYDGIAFEKQPRNDHQKLNGTFTAEPDPARWQGQTVKEPIVTFSADGSFSDEGAFYYVRHVRGYTQDNQDNNYGSGKYDIFNYTITFTYNDGRRIQMTFLDFGPNQISLSNLFLSRK